MRKLSAAFLVFSFLPAAQAQVTVLTHARVIDGTGGTPLEDASIVISGGRIAAMGPSSRVKPPADAQIVDATGKTIMPGIINLHTHIVSDMQTKLREFALYGVTSTASLGFDEDDVLRFRDAQRNGDLHGARLYTVLHRFEFEKDARSPEEARAKVDELFRKHADAVKIVVDDRQHTQPKLKPEISLAVIDQAHKHHLKVIAHIYDYSDARFLVEHGVDILAHQPRDREVDDALINELKSRKVVMISTLTGSMSYYIYADSPAWLDDPFLLRGTTPEHIRQAKTEFKEKQTNDPVATVNRKDFVFVAKNLRREVQAGVRVGFGNDNGNTPTRFIGYFEHLEMEEMAKEGGMTPMQIIVSFSKTNSEALGIDKDYGTLAKGKVADLVVLDRNPLDNILNTRTINAVYLGGKKFE